MSAARSPTGAAKGSPLLPARSGCARTMAPGLDPRLNAEVSVPMNIYPAYKCNLIVVGEGRGTSQGSFVHRLTVLVYTLPFVSTPLFNSAESSVPGAYTY